jgi:hypothetical protein
LVLPDFIDLQKTQTEKKLIKEQSAGINYSINITYICTIKKSKVKNIKDKYP